MFSELSSLTSHVFKYQADTSFTSQVKGSQVYSINPFHRPGHKYNNYNPCMTKLIWIVMIMLSIVEQMQLLLMLLQVLIILDS